MSFENFQSFTFHVGTQVFKDRCADRSFGIWLAVQRSVGLVGRREKFLRDVLLAAVKHVQHGRATSTTHWNALPSFRNATISNGGLKDACDTQVMVAAPKDLALREVRIYMPLVRSRRTFCL